MAKWHPQVVRHYLSEKDLVARTALCSICGPTEVRDTGGRWRCTTSIRISKHRDKMLFKYGLHWENWELMLISQSGRCAICSVPMRKPYIDHCHATGRVRGLLCARCNNGLGVFRDNPDLLRVAATYLSHSPIHGLPSVTGGLLRP